MVTSRERMENGISKYWKEYVSCCIWRTKQEKCKTSLWFLRIPFFLGGRDGWVFFLGPHQWNLKYLKSLSPMLVWATARRSKCMKTWSVPLAILQAKTIQKKPGAFSLQKKSCVFRPQKVFLAIFGWPFFWRPEQKKHHLSGVKAPISLLAPPKSESKGEKNFRTSLAASNIQQNI